MRAVPATRRHLPQLPAERGGGGEPGAGAARPRPRVRRVRDLARVPRHADRLHLRHAARLRGGAARRVARRRGQSAAGHQGEVQIIQVSCSLIWISGECKEKLNCVSLSSQLFD